MIDRNLKYINLYLIYKDLTKIPDSPLPYGYSFRFFREGDEKTWAKIEVSSGDIIDMKTAHVDFERYYKNKIDELKTRCIFLLNEKGEAIGTATGFYLNQPLNETITGDMHWVAIKKEYQGKGLSKPLITKAMQVMLGHGHKGAFVHTQTHTWLAAKIYLDLGWKAYNGKQSPEEFNEGWEIVKKQIER